jgi:ABC-type ATPase involved in cell division
MSLPGLSGFYPAIPHVDHAMPVRRHLLIMRVFEGLASGGQTVIMVTHEPDIAAHARRVVVLRDGRVSSDERREQFVSKVMSGA